MDGVAQRDLADEREDEAIDQKPGRGLRQRPPRPPRLVRQGDVRGQLGVDEQDDQDRVHRVVVGRGEGRVRRPPPRVVVRGDEAPPLRVALEPRGHVEEREADAHGRQPADAVVGVEEPRRRRADGLDDLAEDGARLAIPRAVPLPLGRVLDAEEVVRRHVEAQQVVDVEDVDERDGVEEQVEGPVGRAEDHGRPVDEVPDDGRADVVREEARREATEEPGPGHGRVDLARAGPPSQRRAVVRRFPVGGRAVVVEVAQLAAEEHVAGLPLLHLRAQADGHADTSEHEREHDDEEHAVDLVRVVVFEQPPVVRRPGDAARVVLADEVGVVGANPLGKVRHQPHGLPHGLERADLHGDDEDDEEEVERRPPVEAVVHDHALHAEEVGLVGLLVEPVDREAREALALGVEHLLEALRVGAPVVAAAGLPRGEARDLRLQGLDLLLVGAQ